MVTLTRRPQERGGDLELSRQRVGNALVVYRTGQMTGEAQALALSVAEDAEHDLVVVDLPANLPISAWESVAEALPRRRRGIRLVVGNRSREEAALAGKWLSERLRRTVIAPDGVVVSSPGGTLFVHSGRASGWVRFEPGRPTRWEAKRFPRPSWDHGVTAETTATSSQGVAEPLPGGVWVRPAGFDQRQRPQRHLVAERMPVHPDKPTVVLGAPGNAPLSFDDVSRLWSWLPEDVRGQARFVQFGPLAVPAGAAPGQLLADLLGDEVAFYTGIPLGSPGTPEVRMVRPDGGLGWRPFALELGYRPGAPGAAPPAPVLISHRAPLPDLREVAPAVYWYAPDAVVEVVQSGLLVRGHFDGPGTTALRGVAADPTVHRLAFDDANKEIAGRMRYLAQDLFGRLDQDIRQATRLLPAAALPAGRPTLRIGSPARARLEAPASGVQVGGPAEVTVRAVPGPPVPAIPPAVAGAPAFTKPVDLVVEPAERPEPLEQPTTRLDVAKPPEPERPVSADQATNQIRLESPAIPTVTEVPLAHAEPEPSEAMEVSAPPETADGPRGKEEPVAGPGTAEARLQPVPKPEASALLPGRGIEDERAWLRKTLSQDYGTRSNAVARVLSEHPGFQGPDSRPSADVLADAVAVQLYLSPAGVAVDDALRSAAVGAHVPLARCVVSGLSRLPSHRGPAVFTVSPTPQQWALYRANWLLTEWGFLNALTGPCANLDGDTDVLVWSITARRTKLLETGSDAVPDRVLFVPGTSFKQLELTEPAEGKRGLILLREVAAGEVDETGKVDPNRVSLDELALTSLRGELQKWAEAQRPKRVAKAATSRFAALPGLT